MSKFGGMFIHKTKIEAILNAHNSGFNDRVVALLDKKSVMLRSCVVARMNGQGSVDPTVPVELCLLNEPTSSQHPV